MWLKTKMLFGIMLCVFLVGCGGSVKSRMTDTGYQEFSSFAGSLQKCFDGEHIEPKVYADTRGAFSYQLDSLRYDENKLSNMINQAYSRIQATKQDCRQTEVDAHIMIENTPQSEIATYQKRQPWFLSSPSR